MAPNRRSGRLLLSFLLVATGLWPTGLVAQREAASEAEARMVAFVRTMADRDFHAFVTFISPEAVCFNGNEPLRGRDTIAREWAPFFEGPAPCSWRPDLVQVLESGDLALTSGPVHDP